MDCSLRLLEEKTRLNKSEKFLKNKKYCGVTDAIKQITRRIARISGIVHDLAVRILLRLPPVV
jgi:hypothetical protein